VVELGSLALFETCDQADLDRIASASTGRQTIEEGTVLCAEGDKADRWWIVLEGLADVTIDGLYATTVGPGETIGEMALIDGDLRTATVTATTNMVVEEMDGEPFVEALLASPRLSLALLRQLARRLRAADERRSRPASPSRPQAAPAPAPTQIDPNAEGFYADPYAQFAAMREAGRLHWSDLWNGRVVTRHEDVHRLLRHPTTIGSVASGQPASADVDTMMIRRDGPDHIRLRRLVSSVFTPRAVAQWREKAEEIVDAHIARAADRDEFDVINDYALSIPATVISEMLGVPVDDMAQLQAWSRHLVSNMEPHKTPEEAEAIGVAGQAMHDYLDALVADKRVHPGNDVISSLLQAEEAGDCLDEKEVRDQVILLYVAGHETTVNLIGNGVAHLFQNPDQLERLHSDPSLDTNATEEVLRFDSPAQFTFRIPTEPVLIGDTIVEPGELLVLLLASANRDPDKWGPTADVFDIGRAKANEHVSFGGGPHYCLGAALARMQGQIAIPRLIRRFPRMQPTSDTLNWSARLTVRGLDSFPVTLH
jgi:cytochrome P450